MFIKRLDDYQIAFGEFKNQNPDILTNPHIGKRATQQNCLNDITTEDFNKFRRALVELEHRYKAADAMRKRGSIQAMFEVMPQLLALMTSIREGLRRISTAAHELLAARQHANNRAGSRAVTNKELKEMASCVTDMAKHTAVISRNFGMQINPIKAMTLDQLFPRNPGSPR